MHSLWYIIPPFNFNINANGISFQLPPLSQLEGIEDLKIYFDDNIYMVLLTYSVFHPLVVTCSSTSIDANKLT